MINNLGTIIRTADKFWCDQIDTENSASGAAAPFSLNLRKEIKAIPSVWLIFDFIQCFIHIAKSPVILF